MKKITIYTVLALFILSIVGCEKWLDVNQNPNDLTISTPALVFNGAAKQYGERQMMGSGFALMGTWTGYFSHCGGWSGWNDVKAYNMTSSSYTGFWQPYAYTSGSTHLGDLKSLDYVIRESRKSDNNALLGASKILRVGFFERIVDTYGDVPYFDAGKGMQGITNPVYDDAQAIYEDLIIQLDSAVYFLNRAITAFQDMDKEKDPIMKGNKSEWIKYANALKMRLLLKQAEMPGRDSYIVANWTFDPLGFPANSVTMNPGYIDGQSGKQNPLYNGYYKDYLGVWASANTQYGLNVFLKHLYDAPKDPRMMMCWKPGTTSQDYSHGLQLGRNDALEDHHGGLAGEAIRIGAGIAGTSDGPVYVMSDVEIKFLIAEALARNLPVLGETGTAEDMWEDAIEASFNYYGERAEWTKSDINDTLAFYMDQLSVEPDLGWDAANPVKSIIYQKYVAGVGLYHYQAWTDYRRTGYPETPSPIESEWSMISYFPGVQRLQVPARMLYVQDELNLNTINVNAAITKTGKIYDSNFIMDARIFWDVN